MIPRCSVHSTTFRDFGRRFFERLMPDAYKLMCGAEDEEERQEDRRCLLSLGREEVGAVIAGLLVANLAMAPAAATVVAALVLRLFFKPAYGAMCEVWRTRLPAAPAG